MSTNVRILWRACALYTVCIMHVSEGDSRLKISAPQGNTQACTFATAINLPRVEGHAFISPSLPLHRWVHSILWPPAKRVCFRVSRISSARREPLRGGSGRKYATPRVPFESTRAPSAVYSLDRSIEETMARRRLVRWASMQINVGYASFDGARIAILRGFALKACCCR